LFSNTFRVRSIIFNIFFLEYPLPPFVKLPMRRHNRCRRETLYCCRSTEF
jgi:hypothetical protein